MRIDVKLREELAQQLYEESDRTGVAWVRRPELVKHAFREAAERKLRGHEGTLGTAMLTALAMPTTTTALTMGWDRIGFIRPAITRTSR